MELASVILLGLFLLPVVLGILATRWSHLNKGWMDLLDQKSRWKKSRLLPARSVLALSLLGLVLATIVGLVSMRRRDQSDRTSLTPSPPIGKTSAIPSAQTLRGTFQPVIRITRIPPGTIGNPDNMYEIGGVVSGIDDPRRFRIVLYAYTNTPGQWWIQPFDYNWATSINADGTWTTTVHGGNRYAAVLVRDSFDDPPLTTLSLATISERVLATTEVQGSGKV